MPYAFQPGKHTDCEENGSAGGNTYRRVGAIKQTTRMGAAGRGGERGAHGLRGEWVYIILEGWGGERHVNVLKVQECSGESG